MGRLSAKHVSLGGCYARIELKKKKKCLFFFEAETQYFFFYKTLDFFRPAKILKKGILLIYNS